MCIFNKKKPKKSILVDLWIVDKLNYSYCVDGNNTQHTKLQNMCKDIFFAVFLDGHKCSIRIP